MKLENQVTNLEISKRLKELGVGQRSLFWWQATYSHPMGYTCPDCREMGDKPHPCSWHVAYYGDEEDHFDISAFTVAELGEMLPRFQKFPNKANGCWNFADETGIMVCEATEADARASMLIHLIENGLLKV